MLTIIKVFDEKEYLNNVITPLSLNVKNIIYIYHHKQSKNRLNNNKLVLERYGDFNIHYKQLENDEKEIERYLKEYDDVIVDVSSTKYLSLILFEKALKYNHKIIYYDGEENVIKDYRSHKVITDKVFSLTIDDLLRLSGGVIKNHMHTQPDSNDKKTNDLIVEVVEKSLGDYSNFISYIQKVNHSIIKDENGYHIKDANKIITDNLYKKYEPYHLFDIKHDKITFLNKRIEDLFKVSGSWLESYIYLILKRSEIFEEVMMSVMIDFSEDKDNNYPIMCEIDGIAVKNNRLCFISIKSNKVETDALNEIKTHQERFGNRLSKPIICTLDKLREMNPSIYLKAHGLKIGIVDYDHIKQNEITSTINSIINNTYNYINRL